MRRLRLSIGIFGATALAVAGMAASAQAVFDLVKIREIQGDKGGNNRSYIELQMYAPGQTQIVGHEFVCYDETGAITDNFPVTETMPATPLNGGNQRTILVGDSDAPGGRDVRFNPDSCLSPPSAAGAICFENIDCVSWGGGNFTGAANLPDNSTSFSGALPFRDENNNTNNALRRDISRGCRNLLEPGDDTNNNQADFDVVVADPTRNSVAPGSLRCIGAPKCGGVRATRSGTAGPNLLIGTKRRDVIRGLGGADIIRGRGGKDVLCGGKGRDRLIGGKARDRLLGQAGRDVLVGGPGTDVLRGGPGRDRQRQ